ncbi:hypothetical protein HY838_00660 [Candidatus Azambacteria bacterium]|nr:hypothetical protein [Candidatus Azambacteria bacterium]
MTAKSHFNNDDIFDKIDEDELEDPEVPEMGEGDEDEMFMPKSAEAIFDDDTETEDHSFKEI